MRWAQLSLGHGLIAEEVSDLREDWMTHADQVLTDDEIVAPVYEGLAKRRPKSRSRFGIPAEVVLRMLVLKHARNWSYAVLEREVGGNLVISGLYAGGRRKGAAMAPSMLAAAVLERGERACSAGRDGCDKD